MKNHDSTRNTASQHRKPDYSANLRSWDKPKIQQLQEFIESDPANAVALVPISVGSNVNHNNGRFLAMLKLLKEIGFKSIVILVADVLQRYYRLIESLDIILKDVLENFEAGGKINPSEELIDDALHAAASKQLKILTGLTRKEGYQWILSNINSIEEVFERGNYAMLRWDLASIRTVDNPKHASNDVQSFPVAFSFHEQLVQYEQWCRDDESGCASAVDESTRQFLSRLEQRESRAEGEINFSRLLNKYRKQYGDRYIREETAAMLAMHDHDPRPLPIAYPGGANPALIQAVTDCIKLTKQDQTYPFILGETGEDPGKGLDIRIREAKSIIDDNDTELNSSPDQAESVSRGEYSNDAAGSSVLPAMINPALVHGTVFGPSVNGSRVDRLAALFAQQNALFAQQTLVLQEAMKFEQTSISPPRT